MMKYLIAAMLAAIPLALAPAANADTATSADTATDYLAHLSEAGFAIDGETDAMGLVAMGLAVCVDLYNGFTIPEEISTLRQGGMDSAASARFVQISVDDLCPSARSVTS